MLHQDLKIPGMTLNDKPSRIAWILQNIEAKHKRHGPPNPKKPPPPTPLHTLQREKDKSLEDNVLWKFNTFLSNSKYWILNQKCIPILFKKKVSHVNLELRQTQCRTLFNLTVVCMDNKQSKLQQCLGVRYDLFPSFPCNPMHGSRKGTAKPHISDIGDPTAPG